MAELLLFKMFSMDNLCKQLLLQHHVHQQCVQGCVLDEGRQQILTVLLNGCVGRELLKESGHCRNLFLVLTRPLDEIVDYVKFLRLQVKVLRMTRLGGAGAVVPLVTDIPISSVEYENDEIGRSQPAWEKWSNDGTEQQVAKLMEENIGAAMQFLQSKSLCTMPISLATAIYHTQLPGTFSVVKPSIE